MSTSNRRGFTLIESLGVIAIIAILAGMLLPALANAKQQAWKAVCMSNQKQLMLTSALYGDDFSTYLPYSSPFEIPLRDQMICFTAPGAFHSKKSSLLSFADGQAEPKKWQRPVRSAATITKVPTFHTVQSDPRNVNYIRKWAHHSIVL